MANIVTVLDKNTQKQVGRLVGHTDIVNSAQFSPNGKKIITGSNDKTVKIWDASNFRLLETLEHEEKVLRASFSVSGNCIISTLDNYSVIWWDANTYERIPENYLDKERPYSQESPDKKYILEVPLPIQIP